jgi:hypothetical protein
MSTSYDRLMSNASVVMNSGDAALITRAQTVLFSVQHLREAMVAEGTHTQKDEFEFFEVLAAYGMLSFWDPSHDELGRPYCLDQCGNVLVTSHEINGGICLQCLGETGSLPH